MFFHYKKIILFLLILALAVVFYVGQGKDSALAKVIFLNVGQGDSILVSLPGEQQILIDGGPSEDIISFLGRYIPFHDKEIELVIFTHPHADHLRGLNHVLKNYQVKNVFFSGASYESGVFSEFIELLKGEGAQIWIARAGDKIFWQGQEILEVLWPKENLLGQELKNIHQGNVVTRLTLAGHKFLLTGDAEEDIERELVQSGVLEDIDVLKVGHQGSRASSSWSFLNAVLPEAAVISVGPNSYGHPHQEVLDRLSRLGSAVLRTDQAGDIVWTFRIQN